MKHLDQCNKEKKTFSINLIITFIIISITTIIIRHYVPPLALFFHERRKVYVRYMFVDYVLNHHNAYLSNLLTAQMIQSDYLKVTDSLEKIQKCFLV